MNYFECQTLSPFTRTFVYFDKEPYYSDAIFEKNKIRVSIQPMLMEDVKYHLIFAKIWKKDTDKFTKSMDELNKKMLLCGNRDYTETCENVMEKVFNYIEKEKVKKLEK